MKKFLSILLLLIILSIPRGNTFAASKCYIVFDLIEKGVDPTKPQSTYQVQNIKNLYGEFDYLANKFAFVGDAFPITLGFYDGRGGSLQKYSLLSARVVTVDSFDPDAPRHRFLPEGKTRVVIAAIGTGISPDHIRIKDKYSDIKITVDKSILSCSGRPNSVTLAPVPTSGIGSIVTLSWSNTFSPKNDTSTWLVDSNNNPVYKISLWKTSGSKVTDLISQTTAQSGSAIIPDYLEPGNYYIQIEVIGDPTTISRSPVTILKENTTRQAPRPTPSVTYEQIRTERAERAQAQANLAKMYKEAALQASQKKVLQPSTSPNVVDKPLTVPKYSFSPSPTPSYSPSPSYSPTVYPSSTPTPTYSPTYYSSPASTPTVTVAPKASVYVSPSPTPTVSPSISPKASTSPSPSASSSPRTSWQYDPQINFASIITGFLSLFGR